MSGNGAEIGLAKAITRIRPFGIQRGLTEASCGHVEADRGMPRFGMGVQDTETACCLMLLFCIWEVFSTEEYIPGFLQTQPGRYILEYTLALTALQGTRTTRHPTPRSGPPPS